MFTFYAFVSNILVHYIQHLINFNFEETHLQLTSEITVPGLKWINVWENTQRGRQQRTSVQSDRTQQFFRVLLEIDVGNVCTDHVHMVELATTLQQLCDRLARYQWTTGKGDLQINRMNDFMLNGFESNSSEVKSII